MNIFKYRDYRKYLAAYKKERNISWQKIADEAGFRTNSYIIEIAQGIKDLSKKSFWPLANTMNLSNNELMYFRLMIIYSDTEFPAEKKWATKKMKEIKGRR
jgi:uncharacterized protein (TIGR02147 family)